MGFPETPEWVNTAVGFGRKHWSNPGAGSPNAPGGGQPGESQGGGAGPFDPDGGPGFSTWETGHGRPGNEPGVGEDMDYPTEVRTAHNAETGARAWGLAHPRKFLAMHAGGGGSTRWQHTGPDQGSADSAYLAKLQSLAGSAPIAPHYKNLADHAYHIAQDAREKSYNDFVTASRNGGAPYTEEGARAAGQTAFDSLYDPTLAQLRAARTQRRSVGRPNQRRMGR